jgi:FtsH-binding integral membrane protein
MHGSGIKIWFFIGLSLLVNGVLITGAGIWEWIQPPQNAVVLFDLHASIWWGAILAVFGMIYCYKFAPGRES